jgi:hypothetical protein
MPFPTTRVIPDGWSEHHQPTVESVMTGTGRLSKPGPGNPVRDDTTGKETPPAPTVVASDVACRVQPLTTERRVVQVGDVAVTLRSYLVQVPVDTPLPDIGWTFVVTEANGDDDVIGRPLTIRDVRLATESWSRDLICEDDT